MIYTWKPLIQPFIQILTLQNGHDQELVSKYIIVVGS